LRRRRQTARCGAQLTLAACCADSRRLLCTAIVENWKKITGVGSIFVAGVFLNWLASCVPLPCSARAVV
jgi:hypothetical protein